MGDDGSEKSDLRLPDGEVGTNIQKAFEADQTVVAAPPPLSIARELLGGGWARFRGFGGRLREVTPISTEGMVVVVAAVSVVVSVKGGGRGCPVRRFRCYTLTPFGLPLYDLVGRGEGMLSSFKQPSPPHTSEGYHAQKAPRNPWLPRVLPPPRGVEGGLVVGINRRGGITHNDKHGSEKCGYPWGRGCLWGGPRDLSFERGHSPPKKAIPPRNWRAAPRGSPIDPPPFRRGGLKGGMSRQPCSSQNPPPRGRGVSGGPGGRWGKHRGSLRWAPPRGVSLPLVV